MPSVTISLLLAAQAAAAAPAELPAPAPSPPVVGPTIVRDCKGNESRSDIVVCGRTRERSIYRLPLPTDTGTFDPNSETKSVSRERNGLFNVGDSGVASCSSVGPGGMYGCDFKTFKRWVEQHGK